MSLGTLEIAEQVGSDEADRYVHSVCFCDDNVALCGKAVGGTLWVPSDTEIECVVCADLAKRPCKGCGSWG